jgi:hypothetical protein
MQLRNRLDGYETGRSVLGDGETASIRGDRLIDPAGGVMLQPGVQISRGVRTGDFGTRN